MFGTVLLTMLLLATVVGPEIAIGGWRPDLVVLSVVAFAVAEGPGTGTRYGFAAGLARDLLAGSAAVLGISALVLLVVGTLCGQLRPYLTAAPLPGRILAGALAAGGAFLGQSLLARLLGASGQPLDLIVQGTLGIGLYSAVAAPLVIPPIERLVRRFPLAPTVA